MSSSTDRPEHREGRGGIRDPRSFVGGFVLLALAALALYLTSEAAAPITGANLSIDGGWTAQ